MEYRYYYKDLDLDGTYEELLTQAKNYSDSFSDEALLKIAEIGRNEGKDSYKIAELLVKEKNRKEGLPYERLKIDLLTDRFVTFSETMAYGELEISLDRDKILIAIYGMDDNGAYTAATAFSKKEFLEGLDDVGDPTDDWLESQIGATLYYGKVYEEDEFIEYG